MKRFKNSRKVGHSADEMFALVADIEKYPQFVPLCETLVIRERKQEGTREIMVADMTVSFKLIRETYTSKVVLEPENRRILVSYLDGPFKHLDNRWIFRPINETSSIVDFFISYEFRSRSLQMVMGTMFDQAFRNFAEAFEKRADLIYIG